jgi:hypothetical protein
MIIEISAKKSWMFLVSGENFPSQAQKFPVLDRKLWSWQKVQVSGGKFQAMQLDNYLRSFLYTADKLWSCDVISLTRNFRESFLQCTSTHSLSSPLHAALKPLVSNSVTYKETESVGHTHRLNII